MVNLQRTVSPVDGSTYVERALASPQEIDRALQRAADARPGWQQTPLAERAAICARMVDYLVARADELGLELTWLMGRPLRYTPNEIKGGFQERARYMIEIAGAALQDIDAGPKEGFRRFIRHEPLGVVLALAPWNYPYLTAVNTVIPAVMAGNSVILKHSDQTPLVAERFTEAFRAAGLPEGVFQHLHTTHADIARMIADPRIDFVAFTGSVAGGHAVQQAASGRFIGTGLELGGKDPAYVRADADLEFAINNVIDGAFFNSGQSCCAVERIYVDRRVYPQFVEGAVELIRRYVLGSPLEAATTLGPLVRTRAAEYVRDQIRQAVQSGAKALIDPADFPADRPDTPYLAPQVLVNVDHSMSVMVDESFGPVVGIMAVDGDDEAVALMNDSRYGLTASVWTRDDEAAIAIGSRLNTGTCFMNRCDYLDPALAWTGVGDSGRGCTLSRLGYEFLTRPKSFHLRLAT